MSYLNTFLLIQIYPKQACMHLPTSRYCFVMSPTCMSCKSSETFPPTVWTRCRYYLLYNLATVSILITTGFMCSFVHILAGLVLPPSNVLLLSSGQVLHAFFRNDIAKEYSLSWNQLYGTNECPVREGGRKREIDRERKKIYACTRRYCTEM